MRRRRRLLLGAALVLVLVHLAGQVLDSMRGATHMPMARSRGGSGTEVSAFAWPQQGQAALALGNRRPVASPRQHPVSIASLAKVMTAYLVLKRYPLSGGQEGFTLTVSGAEAAEVAQDRADRQSVVAVVQGEQLTERQLLGALLIPSGNNIARMLGESVTGSEASFVAEMNAEAHALRMDDTNYTDPSGWDPGTVSTAVDQLRLLEQAMRLPAFRQIVSMPSVTLPVAGTLTNFNPLVAEGYAGKTGSDSAAGGCLAFFTPVTIDGRRLTAAGVVLGQGQGSDTRALLAAAGQAAQQLVAAAVNATTRDTFASPVATTGGGDAGRPGRLPAQN